MKDRVLLADDLAALGRRGELGDAEERRLAVALHASPVLRTLHDLGTEYDTLPTDGPEDAALLERAASEAAERWLARPEQGYSGRSGKRGRKRAVVLAVLVSLGAASAAAATVGVVSWVNGDRGAAKATLQDGDEPGEGVRTSPPGTRVKSHAATPPEVPSPNDEPTSDPAVSDQAASDPKPPDVSTLPSRSKEARTPKSLHGATAALLFTEANELRKTGRTREAVGAYQKLMQAHPASAEAALSHVLLGRILLREGQLAGAQTEFQRYLDGNGAGSLAEEALHGSATALAGLGRSAEERRVWQALLARFPSSIYAGKATSRLAALP